MNKIIYLDAAASYQKPETVIRAEMDFLTHNYANAGRGICARASHVDTLIENTRSCVADFIGAKSEQIVFTSGTTDSINKIAGMLKLNSEHIVAVSDLDHHSARLPFEMSGAGVVVCPLDEQLNIDVNNIPYIIFVRKKKPSPEMIELAEENDMVMMECEYSMFKASGILYQNKIEPIY